MQIKLSEEEKGLFRAAAERAHLSLSAWARVVLLAASKPAEEVAWYLRKREG